jgi:hypothetical protein
MILTMYANLFPAIVEVEQKELTGDKCMIAVHVKS